MSEGTLEHWQSEAVFEEEEEGGELGADWGRTYGIWVCMCLCICDLLMCVCVWYYVYEYTCI